MKSGFHKKLVRFATAEVLLQLGFERTTEQALNIVGDIVSHYMESMILRTCQFQDTPAESVMNMLIYNFYGFEKYQNDELSSFLDQQIQIRRQMRDKPEDNILQHALRSLPHENTRSNSLRMINTMAVEERARPRILEEMVLDEFLSEYIEKCNQIEILPRITDYRYDTSLPIVGDLDVKSGEYDRDESGLLPAGQDDDALFSQELFLEDFSNKEKYRVFKLSSG